MKKRALLQIREAVAASHLWRRQNRSCDSYTIRRNRRKSAGQDVPPPGPGRRMRRNSTTDVEQ